MPWASAIGWLFEGRLSNRLVPRWLFLRAIGLIYFSAFFALFFQIRGLIGPDGILPAGPYLRQVAQALGNWERLWYAPTLLWWSSSSHMLMAIAGAGMMASVLLVLNLWPRGMLAICFVCFLSFIAAAQDFSSYQSDGMLLEAGFICFFFAPAGFRPGLGAAHPPSRASLFLLQWEWFRIYFQSGAVKLLSHDPEWRNFTAMDEYYQNGPLPTWIGWYAQHLPHGFHAFATGATLVMELGLVWMLFMPRRWRIVCFCIVTLWQIPVILTANYAFLNYLVLCLGVLLLDDDFFGSIALNSFGAWSRKPPCPSEATEAAAPVPTHSSLYGISRHCHAIKFAISAVLLTWIAYATAAELIWMFVRLPLPTAPVAALEPFRIANQYGLFAVMTRGRYEIEFQGSNDGQNWTPYPFRYKPQALNEAPRIYAPYQPRFDWNLWFASLTNWREAPIVPNTEERLLANDKDVLSLFRGNPFPQAPPRDIRAVLWQYWFTTLAQKRATGNWWRRQYLGLYAPTLERAPDGSIQVVQWPDVAPRE
ncbi:MAG TPA: lipase maturation factor family protein [Terriglobales bacterium]